MAGEGGAEGEQRESGADAVPDEQAARGNVAEFEQMAGELVSLVRGAVDSAMPVVVGVQS